MLTITGRIEAIVATTIADRTRCERSQAGRNQRLTSCQLPLSLIPCVGSRHICSLRLNCSERVDAYIVRMHVIFDTLKISTVSLSARLRLYQL